LGGQFSHHKSWPNLKGDNDRKGYQSYFLSLLFSFIIDQSLKTSFSFSNGGWEGPHSEKTPLSSTRFIHGRFFYLFFFNFFPCQMMQLGRAPRALISITIFSFPPSIMHLAVRHITPWTTTHLIDAYKMSKSKWKELAGLNNYFIQIT